METLSHVNILTASPFSCWPFLLITATVKRSAIKHWPAGDKHPSHLAGGAPYVKSPPYSQPVIALLPSTSPSYLSPSQPHSGKTTCRNNDKTIAVLYVFVTAVDMVAAITVCVHVCVCVYVCVCERERDRKRETEWEDILSMQTFRR